MNGRWENRLKDDALMRIATELGEVQMRHAGAADFEAVYQVSLDAQQWLQSRGIYQWTVLMNSKEGQRQLLDRILHAEVYLALLDGDPVGTLSLQWEDPFFWDERGEDGLAGYVHALAIRRKVGGHGVGRALIHWAMRLIAGHGRPLIRLDCMADNPALCAYYARLGFIDQGVREWPNWRARLYERGVGE